MSVLSVLVAMILVARDRSVGWRINRPGPFLLWLFPCLRPVKQHVDPYATITAA